MLFGYSNAFYDNASIYELNNINQKEYIKEVLNELSSILPKFYSYKIYFLCATAGIIPHSIKDPYKKKILIQWEDQLGTEPSKEIMNSFLCVFKTHLRKKSETFKNLYSYPLGIPYKIKELPIIPINERKYDIFYSGNLNKNRYNFFSSLVYLKPSLSKLIILPVLYIASKFEYNTKLRNTALRLKSLAFKINATNFDSVFKKSIIKFTRSFEAGFSPEQYAEILSQSKIVLSPKGFFNTECFRFYEALRQGCIVITEKLPETDYYNNKYYIEVESWRNIDKIINSLLDNNEKMEEMSAQSLEYYQKELSPKGVAVYLKNKILLNSN
ncbi:hypothetical protein [Phocaeicola plebeius]|jgi:hypothetical protein|uniref:hypothetical protein n=1 Tax=Phocaeicola plebeius TaxID=310297 RepID=UPI0022E0618F|nr:hypothetical protein [Phocaeicola plebeius]